MLSASSAFAQSAPPAAPPPAAQQAYPQQVYPQQAYPQQPQQAYPPPQQQQQVYQPPQGYAPQPPPGYVAPGYQQPYYQPYVAPQGPRRRHPSRALLITGASVLGGAYIISAMVGAILIDDANDYDYSDSCYHDCRATGRWLFLPLAGPWVAMKETRDDGGLAFLGMLQLVGAGLTVGGIIRFLNTKRAIEQGFAWDLGKGRTLTLDTHASPLLTGPQMKLQF